MSKAVLKSVQPKICEKICSGECTVIVSKGKPTLETPFKCYIYCTAGTTLYVVGGRSTGKRIRPQSIIGNRKVIGEFVCDKIIKLSADDWYVFKGDEKCPVICGGFVNDTCITPEEADKYLGNFLGYGLHISDLKIYDKPKELNEFRKPCDRFLDCFLCRRYIRDEVGGCDSKIRRPPQSWCYVEEIYGDV